MTRSWLSTYRLGLITSAGGLCLVFVALFAFLQRPADVDVAARLQTCVVAGTAGLFVTLVGFGLMNVGAVRSGDGYASIDPETFSVDDPTAFDERARAEIVEVSNAESAELDRTPRCLACGTENRDQARYCDQCGERL